MLDDILVFCLWCCDLIELLFDNIHCSRSLVISSFFVTANFSKISSTWEGISVIFSHI